MITRRKYNDIEWVNLENPTEQEIAEITDTYSIHPIVSDELRGPTARSRADLYNDYIYLIVHFPIFRHEHEQKEYWELDFVIGKKFIITSHYEPIQALHELDRIIERDMALDKKKEFTHAGLIFYSLVKHLNDSVLEHLESVSDDIGSIEEGIFSDNEREMVRYIALVNHEVLDVKRALRNHHRLLQSLEPLASQVYGDKFAPYVRALAGQAEKIWEKLEHLKETLTDLRDTNDSLLSSKTNGVMKSLMMLSLLTFPMTLIAAIFAMRTANTPLVDHPQGFWIIVGCMFSLGVLMFGYFKYKKWF